MPNPYTIMRKNVEAALKSDNGLKAFGAKLRSWTDPHKNVADQPAGDHETWLRVETVNLGTEPYWGNQATRSTQTLNIVMALPTSGGLRQEDIEELFDRVNLALLPLREADLTITCPQFSKFTFRGGDVDLADSRDTTRQDSSQNWRWACIGTIEIEYEELVSDMQARTA